MEEGTSLVLAGNTFGNEPVAAADDTVVPPPAGQSTRLTGRIVMMVLPPLFFSILHSLRGW